MNKSLPLMLLGLSYLLYSPASTALTSTFNFSVLSSGSALYPCNVGIAKNLNPMSGDSADAVSVNWSSLPGTNVANSGVAKITGGEPYNLMSIADTEPQFLNWSATGFNQFTSNGITSSYPVFNQLFSETEMYNNTVGVNNAGMVVALTSSTYNSSYYVTFCFQRSKIPLNLLPTQELTITNTSINTSPVGNQNGNINANYVSQAGLKSFMQVKCTDIDGFSNPQHFTQTKDTNISTLASQLALGTIFPVQSTNTMVLSDATLTNGQLGANIPDKCSVRFYFLETSGLTRDSNLSGNDIHLDIQTNARLKK